jgi:hypothetical protein
MQSTTGLARPLLGTTQDQEAGGVAPREKRPRTVRMEAWESTGEMVDLNGLMLGFGKLGMERVVF